MTKIALAGNLPRPTASWECHSWSHCFLIKFHCQNPVRKRKMNMIVHQKRMSLLMFYSDFMQELSFDSQNLCCRPHILVVHLAELALPHLYSRSVAALKGIGHRKLYITTWKRDIEENWVLGKLLKGKCKILQNNVLQIPWDGIAWLYLLPNKIHAPRLVCKQEHVIQFATMEQ